MRAVSIHDFRRGVTAAWQCQLNAVLRLISGAWHFWEKRNLVVQATSTK